MLKAWRFITIMLTAVLMTMGFVHVWQLPPRLAYDGTLWLETLTFYIKFGPRGPGPVLEVAAILATTILLVLVRRRRPAFMLTLLALVMLLLATATWWIFVYPVNRELLGWTPDTLPQNWMDFRNQWEYANATRAGLVLIALGTLLISVLWEPSDAAATSTQSLDP